MKIVSFSLYGTIPKYLLGAVENAKNLSQTEWAAVFYCSPDVPLEIKNELISNGGIVIQQENSWHRNGMFWRYYAVKDFDFDQIIFRDVDSRISAREWRMIQQWTDSKKDFHIIRDHPSHMTPILGGLWGATRAIKCLDIQWQSMNFFGESWGQDQIFLRRLVYPFIKDNLLIHDMFFKYELCSERVSLPRTDFEYVGESLDEAGHFESELRDILRKYQNNYFLRFKLQLSSFCRK
jgi:hypothetical protein